MIHTQKNPIPPQNCAYCNAEFQPKRRWIQKYCCESCRTLACRERNNGVGGTLSNKRRSVSVTDLSIQFQNQQGLIINQLSSNNLMIMEMKFSTEQLIKDNIRTIERSESKISLNQDAMHKSLNSHLVKLEDKIVSQTIQIGLIKNQQSTQQWLTILGSLFGPKIGELIWEKGKEIITGNKEENIMDKLDKLMSIVGHLTNSGQVSDEKQGDEKLSLTNQDLKGFNQPEVKKPSTSMKGKTGNPKPTDQD